MLIEKDLYAMNTIRGHAGEHYNNNTRIPHNKTPEDGSQIDFLMVSGSIRANITDMEVLRDICYTTPDHDPH